jgi:hypothetical protein
MLNYLCARGVNGKCPSVSNDRCRQMSATRNGEVAGIYMKYFYGMLERNLLIYRRKIPPPMQIGG